MKKFVNYVLLVVIILLVTNISSFACFGLPWLPNSPDCNPGSTGAPLDGGLLAILAGAGITYYTVRKKKKNKDKE